jgi:hypothetical protein
LTPKIENIDATGTPNYQDYEKKVLSDILNVLDTPMFNIHGGLTQENKNVGFTNHHHTPSLA